MSGYKNTNTAILEKTLLCGPKFTRWQYAERIESLILDLDPEALVSWEFIYFKITGFRPQKEPEGILEGENIIEDLLRLLENLSRKSPLHVSEMQEQVLTCREAAALFQISLRTIYRWRKRGLPARIYRFPDGKERAGLKRSSLKRFSEINKDLVERSSQFKRISGTERRKIERMLGEKFKTGGSPTEAALYVANKTGRSPESIRSIIHEMGHASRPAIPPRSSLSRAQKYNIFRSMKSGQTASELAELYNKSRQTIYRTYNSVRGEELLQSVSEPKKTILPADNTQAENILKKNTDKSQFSENYKLFLGLNFIKTSISELRRTIKPESYVRASALDELEQLENARLLVIKKLVTRHLNSIIDLTKYHTGRGISWNNLFSIAIGCFLESIHDFDYLSNKEFNDFFRIRILKKFALELPDETIEPGKSTFTPPDSNEVKAAIKIIDKHIIPFDAETEHNAAEYIENKFGLELQNENCGPDDNQFQKTPFE